MKKCIRYIVRLSRVSLSLSLLSKYLPNPEFSCYFCLLLVDVVSLQRMLFTIILSFRRMSTFELNHHTLSKYKLCNLVMGRVDRALEKVISLSLKNCMRIIGRIYYLFWIMHLCILSWVRYPKFRMPESDQSLMQSHHVMMANFWRFIV